MKAVIVGDNLVTSEMFLSRCGLLRDAEILLVHSGRGDPVRGACDSHRRP